MTEAETATAHVSTADDERRRAKREIEELSHAAYDVPAPAPDASGPPTECDVIMKGGITSGVVYPLTICKLATKYRLSNIGGTSAGAIAAVVAAAAEYRRQHDPEASAAGYQALAALPLRRVQAAGHSLPASARRPTDLRGASAPHSVPAR